MHKRNEDSFFEYSREELIQLLREKGYDCLDGSPSNPPSGKAPETRLERILKKHPSTSTWKELKEHVNSLEGSLQAEIACVFAEKALADWPPGLRRMSIKERTTPAFVLADKVDDYEYKTHAAAIREDHPHITCHPLSFGNGLSGPEIEAAQERALSEIQRCRALHVEDRVTGSVLETIGGLADLEELKLERCVPLRSLLGLDRAKRLRELRLENNQLVKTLHALSGAPNLEKVTLKRFEALVDLYGLEGCKGLQTLSLESCTSLKNMGVLEHCESLRSLELICCGVEEMESARRLDGLRQLRLESLPLRDLSFLEGMEDLDELVVEDCTSIEDFSALARLPNLQSLRLVDLVWHPSLDSLSSLKGLRRLEIERVQGMTDLRCLRGLGKLTTLKLQGTSSLQSLEGLECLQSLGTLSLEEIRYVQNSAPLSQLGALRSLSLGERAFKPLAKFGWYWSRRRDVQRQRKAGTYAQNEPLNDYMNALAEEEIEERSRLLQHVLSLSALERLHLESLPDFPAFYQLSTMPALRGLCLKNCYVEEWVIEEGFHALEALQVIECDRIRTLRFLKKLPALSHLHVEHCPKLESIGAEVLGELRCRKVLNPQHLKQPSRGQ